MRVAEVEESTILARGSVRKPSRSVSTLAPSGCGSPWPAETMSRGSELKEFNYVRKHAPGDDQPART